MSFSVSMTWRSNILFLCRCSPPRLIITWWLVVYHEVVEKYFSFWFPLSSSTKGQAWCSRSSGRRGIFIDTCRAGDESDLFLVLLMSFFVCLLGEGKDPYYYKIIIFFCWYLSPSSKERSCWVVLPDEGFWCGRITWQKDRNEWRMINSRSCWAVFMKKENCFH